MLQLRFNTSVPVFLTLAEKTTISNPNYLFIFSRRLPGQTKATVLTPNEVTDRYERFDIDVTAVFTGKDYGEWQYTVYEQESIDNIDPAAAGAIVETGLAIVHKETPTPRTVRQTTTVFTQRQ